MIEVDWQLTGMFAWLRSPRWRADVRRITRKANKQAINEWLTRRHSPALRDRFKPGQRGRLQLAQRSPGYERRQVKFFGRVLPYRSPTHRGTFGTGHMAELILKQKRFRVAAANNTGDVVVTRFRITGARILNRIKQPYGDQYRREFLRLRHGSNRADRDWIERRSQELIWQGLEQLWKRQQRKALRVARQLAA